MDTDPERYQPRLSWHSHLWRYLLCLVISGLAWASVADGQINEHPALLVTDIVLGIASYVLVFWRRRWPLQVAIILSVVAALSGIAAGPAVLASVSLATRRIYWQLLAVGLISIAAGEVFVSVQPQRDPSPWWVDLLINVAVTVAILGWGMYIGSRRQLLWTLRDQVAQAEEKARLLSSQARTSERSRIAREMHDVLAHRISQVSLHANAVMFREDLSAEEIRKSVAVIQEKANAALVDLRGVLGVLRDPATGEILDRPQPTSADLPALVDEARASGMHIEYADDVRADGDHAVPELAGRTLYRLVQESLTNARKHAPAAAVSISLTGSVAEGLTLEVRNPLGFHPSTTPGAGLGLVGLRERLELAGGTLTAGREQTHWVVRGWVPWEN
ncbi:sensor histidine kinase [Nocardioides cavernaquae]|uniref:histidine kinase n=1 Tax=Nocardioides cavernaquae TaxID=2321396 RepID=A0A3A5HAS4_9ACTN|nr:histidine kinase [Nocardioides cavernaquae]RJS45140.1 histidine kinase [Nocardioides cavernaquae]